MHCTKTMAACAKKTTCPHIFHEFRPHRASASQREGPIPTSQTITACVYFWNLRLLPDRTKTELRKVIQSSESNRKGKVSRWRAEAKREKDRKRKRLEKRRRKERPRGLSPERPRGLSPAPIGTVPKCWVPVHTDCPCLLKSRHAATSHVPTPVAGIVARPARPAPGSWDASPS